MAESCPSLSGVNSTLGINSTSFDAALIHDVTELRLNSDLGPAQPIEKGPHVGTPQKGHLGTKLVIWVHHFADRWAHPEGFPRLK